MTDKIRHHLRCAVLDEIADARDGKGDELTTPYISDMMTPSPCYDDPESDLFAAFGVRYAACKIKSTLLMGGCTVTVTSEFWRQFHLIRKRQTSVIF